MVSVTVKAPGKPAILLEFPNKHPDKVTVGEIKQAVHAKFPKLTPVRQRLTIISPVSPDQKVQTGGKPTPPVVLAENTLSLASYGIPDSGAELKLKDLGMQLGWTTVYVWEYLGPLFIHPLLFWLSTERGVGLPLLLSKLGLPSLGLGKAVTFTPSLLQKTVYGMIMIHFLKREYESVFIHKFSKDTMPAFNVIKNSTHYWGLSGLLASATLYQSNNSAAALKGTIWDNPTWIFGWAAVWAFAQASNFVTHVNLRNIRTPPGTKRKFPKGYGFNLVSTANYFFDQLAWFAMVAMSGDVGLGIFLAVAGYQMAIWADKRHRTYKKEHGDKYPKGRKRMIPFIW